MGISPTLRWLFAALCLALPSLGSPTLSFALEAACADVDASGDVSAVDALAALRAAVALNTCEPCRCDVDAAGGIRASDALMILKVAVGNSVQLTCRACPHGQCGDGELAPYAGSFFTGSAFIATCEELDSGGPGSPPPYDTTLLKAFNRNLQRIDGDVTVIVDNNGCFCHDLITRKATDSAQQITVTASSTTLTSMDCSDCFFSFTIETTSEIAALELETGFTVCGQEAQIPGMRTEINELAGSSLIRIDGGIPEECDDGNQEGGDGCSSECGIEFPKHCHFDAGSQECTGLCGVGASCLPEGSGACVCAEATCGQCWSTLDTQCFLHPCLTHAHCPPNAFCGGGLGEVCGQMACPCCPRCGDGECNFDEPEATCGCVEDCGGAACTPEPSLCGNTFCDSNVGERHETCPADCPLACHECLEE